VALALLLDEHLSPSIAHDLAALLYDVTCVRDRGLSGMEDWDLIDWCTANGRAFCTQNARHFEREHRRYQNQGKIHFGIILVGQWTAPELFQALKTLLETTPEDDLLNQIITLPDP
jgi:predicted nuclease of predicted toxin-antitoxin system